MSSAQPKGLVLLYFRTFLHLLPNQLLRPRDRRSCFPVVAPLHMRSVGGVAPNSRWSPVALSSRLNLTPSAPDPQTPAPRPYLATWPSPAVPG
jgi:hypothetical protein